VRVERDEMASTLLHTRRLSDIWLPAPLLIMAVAGWWWSARMAADMRGGMTMSAGATLSFLAFIGAWVAMMAAMMLPAMLPVVRLYQRAAARGTVAPVAAFVAGYLIVWSSVGVPAYFAWRALRQPLADADPWAGRLAGAVAITSAVYQVTPLKTVCLRQCRSPMSFFLRHGNNLSRPTGAALAGTRHGLYCLGCCWLLMAILISFGTMQIAVMVAVAVLILLEKDAPYGVQLARVAAVAFLILGVVLLARPSFIGHIA
jgi:predicted metal-binding membrane protein